MDDDVRGSDGTAADDRRDRVVTALRQQSRFCERMGSPLYASLLGRAADDAAVGGPTWGVLAPHTGVGFADALALRLMAALHTLVLTRRAPALALHYPSVGGAADDTEAAWAAARDVIAARGDEVSELLARPCQTNEVGRCAALVWGWLDVAASTGLPLRCLEVGASAGLALRWPAFRYGTADGPTWGPDGSPVDLRGLWSEEPSELGRHTDRGLPHRDLPRRDLPRVVERRGCDRAPVDPLTPGGRLALTASVWADMTDRLARLRGALALAATDPVEVDAAPLDVWTADRLATPAPAVATVVSHAVVAVYVPDDAWSRFTAAIAAAAEQATRHAPLAWLRLESAPGLQRHAVTLTTWRGAADDGQPRVIATCGAHGQDVRAPSDAQRDLVLAHIHDQGRHVRRADDRGDAPRC